MRALWLAAAGVALGPAGASAHAFLHDASPAVGSTVARAPGEVVIDFTEAIEPVFSTIVVTDAAGRRVEKGAVRLEGGDARLAVALGPLAAGRYTVDWHATAVDTHKTQGRFSFTVGEGR